MALVEWLSSYHTCGWLLGQALEATPRHYHSSTSSHNSSTSRDYLTHGRMLAPSAVVASSALTIGDNMSGYILGRNPMGALDVVLNLPSRVASIIINSMLVVKSSVHSYCTFKLIRITVHFVLPTYEPIPCLLSKAEPISCLWCAFIKKRLEFIIFFISLVY